MSRPRLSVLLPTYNARDHIETCLDSLRRQTFQDFEIVVVDDGSTDGTIEYLRDVDDVRLFVRSNTGDGLPGALNYGLERARGEYVARQDADDLSYPERFARQVDVLDANPDVALIGTAIHLIAPDGSKRSTRVPPAEPDLDSLLEKNRFVHGSVTFRRDDVLAAGGYDTGFEYTEDYDLWLRLAGDHTLRNLQTPLYALRVHDDSIYGARLRTVKLYGYFARQRARGETDLTIEDVQNDGAEVIYEEFSADERVAFQAEMAQEFLRYGRPQKAREACRHALRLDPATPLLWLLFGLSFAPPGVIAGVEAGYRWVSNRRHSA